MLAARQAGAGARVGAGVLHGPGSVADVLGLQIRLASAGTPPAAIEKNWLKAYPCCLQTHGAVDAGRALSARIGPPARGEGVVVVHPLSRQAAALDDVETGLEARFSIPYTTAWGALRGAPTVVDLDGVDEEVRALARRLRVTTDRQLDRNACVLRWRQDGADTEIVVDVPRGAPDNPLAASEHATKIESLAGPGFAALFDDLDAPARQVRAAMRVAGRDVVAAPTGRG